MKSFKLFIQQIYSARDEILKNDIKDMNVDSKLDKC